MPKSKTSLPKVFKKPPPDGASNNRPANTSRPSNSNRPSSSSQAKTITDKRKPAQSPRLNRRPGQKPEVL